MYYSIFIVGHVKCHLCNYQVLESIRYLQAFFTLRTYIEYIIRDKSYSTFWFDFFRHIRFVKKTFLRVRTLFKMQLNIQVNIALNFTEKPCLKIACMLLKDASSPI